MANALGYVRRDGAPHGSECRADCCWRPATLADLNQSHDLAAASDEALRDGIHFDNELWNEQWRYGGSE